MRWMAASMVFIALVSPRHAQSAPENVQEAIALGKDAYDYGDYKKAIKVLTPLVQPKQRITKIEARVDVYCVIGLSNFFLKDREQALSYFEQAIRLRPDKALDSVVTPPEAIRLFEKLKKRLAPEIAKLQRELEMRRLLEAERRRLENIRYQPVQVNSRLVAALPFGAGQFQNGSPVLGAVFLGSEVAAISVSLASFLAVESLRGADGRFRNADVEQARSYQQLQLVSGGIALAVIAGGIIEAMVSYRSSHKLGKPRATPNLGVTPSAGSSLFSVSF